MSPKAFTLEEKERVRQELIKAAQSFLSTTGIRKTTVEQLSHAVGISKGAFYIFFDSKELLFLEALEQEEQRIHETILQEIDKHPSKQEVFVSVISQLYRNFVSKPWLLAIANGEYEILLRRIPQQRIERHIAMDDAATSHLLKIMGENTEADPELVSAILRMLFMAILHRKEIGEKADQAFLFTLKAISSALFSEDLS